jgi:thioredoxin reductase
MIVQYMHCGYEDYKELERQMKEFKETVHTTVSGYHHKSIRLKVNKDLIIEYHGPLVAGGYDQKTATLKSTGEQPNNQLELPLEGTN